MKNIFKISATALMIIIIAVSCQKLSRPALGDYPKDSSVPGGPLKFYAAFDGSIVDSIRANYGIGTNASFGTGVLGKAVQLDGTKNGYVSFPSANDFGKSTSFSIAFWINITLAQKDNNHAVGILSFANSSDFWGNITFYADNNAKSPSDSMDLKIHFNDKNNTDNWNFAGYNFAKAWPHMYDGNWHQIAFTYDAVSGTGVVYRDGVQFDKKTGQSIVLENPSQMVVGGFQEAAGIVGKYADNTWMAGFPGKIDQVRLYGVALAPADIAALYTNKQ